MKHSSLKSRYKSGYIEAGCDEAGRGCLAGPVFTAAVILPDNFSHPILNDSKLLSPAQRYSLRDEIKKYAVGYAVAMLSNNEIDKLNILKASIFAMHKALNRLHVVPEHIIVDGNRFIKFKNIPHKCIVKGDSKYYSIAAASVLAKTYRDDYMLELHKKFPEYNWAKNKGYPTLEHRQAIAKYGITPYHRKSFKLIEKQFSLF
ncbi:MAG: ribonuclease HII [Bacteroidia bacterium]|nr:ribonuclease HII [Bacteroidia bacterium]